MDFSEEVLSWYAEMDDRIDSRPEFKKISKEKDQMTNGNYSKIVHILLKIGSLMKEDGIASAEKVTESGLEDLIWNIPNEVFTAYRDYKYTVDEVIRFLYMSRSALSGFKKADGSGYLFHSTAEGRNCVAFITDLKKYYHYTME